MYPFSGRENAGMHSPSPQGQNFRIEVLHSAAAQRAQYKEVLSDRVYGVPQKESQYDLLSRYLVLRKTVI